MQILMYEVGACDTVDPLAGSWFIESATNQMETESGRIMAETDAAGGIVAAVAAGRVQAEVNRQAYEAERRLQRGEVQKVGVNCFVEEEESRPVAFHPYREEEAVKQVERLKAVRARRDGGSVAARLEAVRQAAREERNVMPAVLDAVEAYATVGEVCGALKDVYGTYREPVRF
jgi:methylmalonyl-CoA mutase N-terminal domain/subunit